jgi:hypothetical protein
MNNSEACSYERNSNIVTSQRQTQKITAEMKNDVNSTSCALFMQGLPQNFSTNVQLLAIASLLGDTIQEEVVDQGIYKDDNDCMQQIYKDDNDCMKQTVKTTLLTSSKKTVSKYRYQCVGKRYAKAKVQRPSIKFSYGLSRPPPRPRETEQQQDESHYKKTTTTTLIPFPTPPRKTSTPTSLDITSSSSGCDKANAPLVGETMLFLNMWKL